MKVTSRSRASILVAAGRRTFDRNDRFKFVFAIVNELVRTSLRLAFACCCIGLPPNSLLAQTPGQLDSSFGTGGIVTTSLTSADNYASATVVQPDGKILAVGFANDGITNHFALTRYNGNGTLDTSFGANGKVMSSLGGAGEAASAVALQTDGKIVVAGSANNGSNFDFAVARYTTAGALDTTFNGTGYVTTAMGTGDDYANSVAIQTDGRIVVGGSAVGASQVFALARYNTDGSLDLSFGANGKVTNAISSSVYEVINGIALQTDGRIVAAGLVGNPSIGDQKMAVARYNIDGSFDANFNSTGIEITSVDSFCSYACYGAHKAVAIQSDGSIVATGTLSNGTSGAYEYLTLRYTPTGPLDNSFGSGGIVRTVYGAGGCSSSLDQAYAVAIQANGKILVGGYTSVDNGGCPRSVFGLVRYNSDGSLDTTFGTNGKTAVSIGAVRDGLFGLALQKDGNIVAAGFTQVGGVFNFALARYQGDAVAVCVVPPSGLVSWWAGDGNALDIQGANIGAMVGGAAFGSGKVGQSFSMSYPGYVDVNDSESLHLASAITIDAWVYRNVSANTFQTIVKKADEVHGYSLELEDQTGRVIFFIFSHNSGAYGWVRATSTTVLQANTWYHVAGTFDGSLLRIYVNGTLENTGTPFSNTIDWSYGHLNIGADPSHLGDSNRYWSGLIDEVEIFNRALSDAEIASLYNAGSAGKCKPSGAAATSLSVSSASGPYAGSATLQATLTRTSGNSGVSGQIVNFTLNGNGVGSAATDASGVATLNGASLSGINGGTYASGVGASFAGVSSFAPSNAAAAQLVVNPIDQTINFASLSNKNFGDPDFGVGATASSGLTVTFTVGVTDNCTISGTTVHLTGAGSCTVTAHQAGDTNYKAATDVPQTFSIGMANQTITFTGAAASAVYGSTFIVSASASSGLAVTLGASGACSISGTTAKMIGGTGTCNLTADQLGNGNYNAAAQATQSTTAQQAGLTVTADGKSKVYGAPIPALTATITGLVNGDNSSVVSGSPSCTTTAIQTSPVTTYPITCTVGTLTAANYTFNSFVPGVLTITQTPTTTTLVSNHNPANPGQSVNLTATVTSAAGTPTGSVTFYDNASPLSTVALAGGTAVFITSSLITGTHPITAVYGGATNFSGSTSSVLSQVVKASTTTTVSSNANPAAVFGQAITFTAIVSAGSGTPDGSVTFKDGGATLGTMPLSGGSASLIVSTLTVGSHSITAVYSGSVNYVASTSAPLSQTVNSAATGTTLGSSVSPSVFGQSLTFTATVSAVAPGAGTPTGTVTFKDGGTTLGTATLSGGKASLTTSTLAVSPPHSIVASYAGSANFAASSNSSSPLSQMVNQAATTTNLSSSKNPSKSGQSVAFTATVTAQAPGGGTPAGTVTFLDNGNPIGSAATLNSKGQAAVSTSTLPKGSHAITAVYGTSTNYTGSTSSTVTQVVN